MNAKKSRKKMLLVYILIVCGIILVTNFSLINGVRATLFGKDIKATIVEYQEGSVSGKHAVQIVYIPVVAFEGHEGIYPIESAKSSEIVGQIGDEVTIRYIDDFAMIKGLAYRGEFYRGVAAIILFFVITIVLFKKNNR